VTGPVRTRDWAALDYYRELGVAPDASRAAIDEAYRRQAKTWHPDRNADARAEDRFKALNAAYVVLRDPASRRAYDDFRARVDEGRLYGGTGSPPPPPGRAWSRASEPPAPPRRPRRAVTVPDPVRVGIGVAMLVAAAVAAVWALVGELPSNSAGDTRLAVQITLLIMAAKLVGGAYLVIRYPQLRARWHRPPPRTA
jgi:hypothetical protein